jgi:hypothetical protein
VVALAIGFGGRDERDDLGDQLWHLSSSDGGGRWSDRRDLALPFRCAVKSANLQSN